MWNQWRFEIWDHRENNGTRGHQCGTVDYQLALINVEVHTSVVTMDWYQLSVWHWGDEKWVQYLNHQPLHSYQNAEHHIVINSRRENIQATSDAGFRKDMSNIAYIHKMFDTATHTMIRTHFTCVLTRNRGDDNPLISNNRPIQLSTFTATTSLVCVHDPMLPCRFRQFRQFVESAAHWNLAARMAWPQSQCTRRFVWNCDQWGIKNNHLLFQPFAFS